MKIQIGARGYLLAAMPLLLSIASAFQAQPSLGGAIAGKTGPANARVWSFQLGNSGPGDAVNVQLTGINFVRTNGPACAPVLRTSMPLAAGTISAQGTARVSVTIDFSGCDASALFKVTAGESANGGGATGSIVRLNQFQ